jgi:uncharacterized surface protein with fasciclin (FAS1) repeats
VQLRRTVALALAGAALITASIVPAASATEPKTIASVLDDGSGFDKNWYDYDILDTAVKGVLGNNANSPLWAATEAETDYTVFAPNDRAFQVLVASLTGKWYWTESSVTTALITYLGGDPAAFTTLETVILYHVYTTGPVDFATAKSISPTSITMAEGTDLKLRFNPWPARLVLGARDFNAVIPWVVNSQRRVGAGDSIVHGISLVLRFTDLPPLAR